MTPEKVLEILKETDIECSYGRFTTEQVCECGVMNSFERYMDKNYPEVRYSIETGATKCVIVFDDEDFVIKIPFTGFEDWEEYNDCDEEDYDPFYEFEYNDYCELEVEAYDRSIEAGFEFALAEIKFIGMVGEFPIYMQEKATNFWEGKTDHSNEEITSVKNQYKYDMERLDPEWVLDFISWYGKTAFERFLGFILEAHINDLHNGNVGYICGAPVLIDYSGYWE